MRAQFGVQVVLSERVITSYGDDAGNNEKVRIVETRTFIPCIDIHDATNLQNSLVGAPVLYADNHNRVSDIVVRFNDRGRSVIVNHEALTVVAGMLGFVHPSSKPNGHGDVLTPPKHMISRIDLRLWYKKHLGFAPDNFRDRPPLNECVPPAWFLADQERKNEKNQAEF